MSSAAIIAYPSSFLERPEDRSFLIELESAQVPIDKARLILYRIWADFGTGGSDRRPIHTAALAEDRQIRVLEAYCEWHGPPSALVRMAVAAGFLSIASGEQEMLVCTGFYPINSAFNAKGRSFQRRGGLSRVLKDQTNRAEGDAELMEKLWERTGNPFQDLPPETCKRATRFIFQICRTLGLPAPDAAALQSGIMRMAIECVQTTEEERIKETLLWLLSRRKEPDMPTRLDAIIRAWPSYVTRSTTEMQKV